MNQTARQRLIHAEFVLDWSCDQFMNDKEKRDHYRRRMELMLYAIPMLEMEAAREDRNRVKEQMTGFFSRMAQDFAGPFPANRLRA